MRDIRIKHISNVSDSYIYETEDKRLGGGYKCCVCLESIWSSAHQVCTSCRMYVHSSEVAGYVCLDCQDDP
jgi:hypothetical protein